MPRLPNNKKPKPKKPQVASITCLTCAETKKSSEFYTSSSVFHAGTGRVPYCKVCLKNMSVDENGNIDNEKFKKVLKEIDKPYLHDVLQSAYNQAKKVENGDGDVIGIYFKNINSLGQYKSLGWADSIFEPIYENEDYYNKDNIKITSNFILTDEIKDKWGNGYKLEEYESFEKKYSLLKNNYSQKTAMHTEALLNYIRYRVKEELATALGDVKEAKEWGSLASSAATAAKINPSQLSKADLSDGLSTFSELSQAVEKEVDIIPILPRFKYRPNDALDFNIWCYVNYIRDLSGLPPCKYEDIYAFYDRRKQDYIKQYGDPYGIFTDDPTEKNRENIKKFISEDGD